MSNYVLVFTSKSENEFIDSAIYYETKQKGLGYKFSESVNEILNSISKNPFAYQRKYKHYREAVLKVFPFTVIYEIKDNEIIINAIFHTKRNPKKKIK
jgi:hypothetical protein